MYFYKSKSAYEANAKDSIKDRPIVLSDYEVIKSNNQTEGFDQYEITLKPNGINLIFIYSFYISNYLCIYVSMYISDDERDWKFRVDTMEEVIISI